MPGTVAAFDTIQQRYGKLSRQAVMAPAIELAEAGFVVNAELASLFALMQNTLARSDEGRRLF